MDADAKRLSPTKGTIRELFGKCGNQCAFPGCRQEIINHKGVFVAQICHIEAAERGGPRFNKKQTNEERRHVSNLLLMCHKHHKITDHVDEYPTATMREIKEKHEAKYLDAATKIWASIEDHTDSDEISLPKTFKRFFKAEAVRAKDREAVKDAVHTLATRLKPVPGPSRELLLHSVRRASNPEHYDSSMRVLPTEVAQACGLRRKELWDGVHILIRHKLVNLDEDYQGLYCLSHIGDLDDWNIWLALRNYCEEMKIDLRIFLVDLDFSRLD